MITWNGSPRTMQHVILPLPALDIMASRLKVFLTEFGYIFCPVWAKILHVKMDLLAKEEHIFKRTKAKVCPSVGRKLEIYD